MAAADERLFQIFRHHDTIHSWLVGRRLLDVYETTLLGWVISQMEWISRRTPPPLRRSLFDTLVPIFAEYSPAALASALRDGNKGAAAQRMSAAVAKRDFGSFAGTLASRPGSSNLLLRVAFHLRHSGAQHTAVLAARYLRRQAQEGRFTQVVNRARRGGREPGPSDVMFGLIVLQRQLQGLEKQLGQIEGRFGDLEHRLEEPGAHSSEALGVDEEGRNGNSGLGSLDDAVGRG